MKRSIFTTVIVLMIVLATAEQALAGYCIVTKEGDTATNEPSTQNITLRGAIELDVNTGGSSSCTMRYFNSFTHKYETTNDYEHFSQGILFDTNVTGVNVSSYKVDGITFTKSLTIDATSSIVIGNISLETVTDEDAEVEKNMEEGPASYTLSADAGATTPSRSYQFYSYDEAFLTTYFNADWNDTANTLVDYGDVLIDAGGLSSGTKPFKCRDADSANVYLRNLVIITNGVSESQLFDGGCIKNGGNSHVCDKAAWTGDLPDESADWCPSEEEETPGEEEEETPGEEEEEECAEEDKLIWYRDADGDTYGTSAITYDDCDQPSGYVANDDDCDDANASVHPSAAEDCADTSGAVDNDCDGYSACDDDSCDSDNACNGVGIETDCSDGVNNDGDSATDCADSDCASNSACYTTTPTPSLGDDTETSCTDNVNNDSDDDIDCDDSDCVGNAACAATDADADGYTQAGGDCDDSNGDINPGETEICADLIDNDCDGVTDETDSCVDPSVGDGSGATVNASGAAGGCGCDLKAHEPTAQNMMAALFALIPAFLIGWLRSKAMSREPKF